MIKDFLQTKLECIKVSFEGDLLQGIADDDAMEIATALARSRVRSLGDPNVDFEPMYGEVQFEKNRLSDPSIKGSGVLYDGIRMMDALGRFVPRERRSMDNVNILFTNRLLGTFDPNDSRYHARVIVCGFPTMISSTGLIEAPARPKEFYLVKQRLSVLDRNIPIDVIKDRFKDRFIDRDDERITEVMKGYALQAIFYHLNYEPFCEDGSCRLFNAHWQEEVIKAQLGGRDLCKRHEEMLRTFRKANKG